MPAVSEPFFLLDQCLSPRIARQVLDATGHRITTVRDEWPERDLNVNPPQDQEIIPHLGNRGGHRGVWITLDWDASVEHADLIDRWRISALWLRPPEGAANRFSLSQQSQLLVAVVDSAYRIVADADAPVYLRARLASGDAPRPVLERLAGSLPDAPRRWQLVQLG